MSAGADTKVNATEADVLNALRVRYQAPAFAFLSQVPTGTGGRHTATIDGIAIGTWPSRGLFIHGFEVKVSRSDWLRELAKPSKAEWGTRHCDYWSIVAPPGIVHTGELPGLWGHIEYKRGRLRCIHEPHELPSGTRDSKTAMPISRTFVAAIARKIDRNCSTAEDVDRKVREAVALAIQTHEPQHRAERDRTDRELKALREAVDEFDRESGINIRDGMWRGIQEIQALGRIVNKIRNEARATEHTISIFKAQRERLSAAVARLTDTIGEVIEYEKLRSGVAIQPDENPDLAHSENAPAMASGQT